MYCLVKNNLGCYVVEYISPHNASNSFFFGMLLLTLTDSTPFYPLFKEIIFSQCDILYQGDDLEEVKQRAYLEIL